MIEFRTNPHEKQFDGANLCCEGAENGLVDPDVTHAFVLDASENVLLLLARGFGLPHCCFRIHAEHIFWMSDCKVP
jgi:hypothetical protein